MPRDDPPNNGLDAQGPLEELKDLQQVPSTDFLARIRSSVWRRETAGDVTKFSWALPLPIFLELGQLLLHVMRTIGRNSGRRL